MASNGSDPGFRPRIGVTTYLEPASYGVWDQPSAVLPRSYVDAVVRAGGVPVLLPPVGDAYDVLAAGMDGLLLSGGADIDPARYGEAPHAETDSPRAERDAFEFGLLQSALDSGLPVLGVCRGFELLNVAFGGSLVQHLPDAVGHPRHRPAPAEYGVSRISLAAGSRVAGLLGPEVKVRCYHHQAVGRLADGLTAVGWADDGTVEALELPGERFVLGVQWHPEETLDDLRLFAALVAAAGEGLS